MLFISRSGERTYAEPGPPDMNYRAKVTSRGLRTAKRNDPDGLPIICIGANGFRYQLQRGSTGKP